MNILIVIKGAHRGQRFILVDGELILGRDKKVDIPFEDEGVSRRHVKFKVKNQLISVIDLGSTNGTYVNNLRIEKEQRLHNGDRITIGNTLFLVKLDNHSTITSKAVVSESHHNSSSMLRVDMASSSVLELIESKNQTLVSSPDEGQHSFLALYNFITKISGILEIEQLLELAIQEIVEMVKADRGAVLLLNQDALLEPSVTFNKKKGAEVAISKTLVEDVLASGKGILSSEVTKDERFKKTVALSVSEINSMCCVPLLVKDKTLGVLYIDTANKSRKLNEYCLRLLTAMALELSICIENTSLYSMLKDSEEFSSCVLTCMAGGLLVVDTNGKIVRANINASQMVGFSVHEITGKGINTVPPYDDLSIIFRQTIKSGRSQENENLNIYHQGNGNRIPVGVGTTILEDYAGKQIGVVIHFRDLTHIHKLSEQVKRAERLGALGQMASGIAHEIRNPLNSVQGFVQLLQENVNNDKDREYCHIVLDEVKRINNIVQDMLDFSRQQDFNMEIVDIQTLVQEICEHLRFDAEREEVSLLQPVAHGKISKVKANADKLRQVLLNVIMNALQATPAGGKVLLEMKMHSSGSEPFMLKISIIDTGVGISKDNLSKIFDPFYTTKDSGTGLGLSICQKIIEQHGGRITVDSVIGEGTSFHIFLPPER